MCTMHGNRELRENLVPLNFTPLKVMPMMLDLKVPQQDMEKP